MIGAIVGPTDSFTCFGHTFHFDFRVAQLLIPDMHEVDAAIIVEVPMMAMHFCDVFIVLLNWKRLSAHFVATTSRKTQ